MNISLLKSFMEIKKMPYKNKADANSASRRRWANDPEVRSRGKAATKLWEENNKEDWNEYRANWAKMDRASDIEAYHAKELARDMKKYGTTVEWYRDQLIEQNGLCAMCGHLSHHHGTIQRLQVDHDHKCCDLHTKSCGKCLRGLLCADCNILLSYLERFLNDFPKGERQEICEVDFRNSVRKDSWTFKALKYLRRYSGDTAKNN